MTEVFTVQPALQLSKRQDNARGADCRANSGFLIWLLVAFRARYAYKEIGGQKLYVRTYEGTIPGPTLRCRPGDVLRIRLINDLPPNRDVMPLNSYHPHHFNTTNFHLHGSHVSPDGIVDNVMRSMEPGQSYDVEIPIPRDHTSGTYWYHPPSSRGSRYPDRQWHGGRGDRRG